MAMYERAFETEVYAEEKWIYIAQRQEGRDQDLIMLNADQAAWLLVELESAIKELA